MKIDDTANGMMEVERVKKRLQLQHKITVKNLDNFEMCSHITGRDTTISVRT